MATAKGVFPRHRLSPSGPILPGESLVRVGYDAIVEELAVPPPALLEVYPRNTADDPVEVVFDDFEPGDILEIDARVSGIMDEPTDLGGTAGAVPLVSLDGGVTFFIAVPATAGQLNGADGLAAITSYWAGVITDPMPVFTEGNPVPTMVPLTAPPIVRLMNTSDVELEFGGLDESDECGSLWLVCRELRGSVAFQPPPGVLFTLPVIP